MSKISELSDGGVIQGGDTLIAVRSGGNVKVTYGGTTTANIDGGTIDGTTIGGTTPAAGSFTSLTSTGIDVTGTVTADGLTVDGTSTFNTSSTLFANLNYIGSTKGTLSTDGINLNIEATANLYTKVNGATRALFGGNGDISFYEDTGTTAKFFWDASDERLGIGTTSADGTLHVHSGSAGTITAAAAASNLVVENNGAVGLSLLFDDTANNAYGNIYWGNETDGSADGRITYFGSTYVTAADRQSMEFRTAGTARMRIESDGNLRVYDVIDNIANSLTLNGRNTGQIRFESGGNLKMSMDASGNLLVGTTDSAPAVSNTEVGVALSGSLGYVAASRSAGASGFFNRLSDGDIVNFNKDGTTVGSIGKANGSASQGLYISGDDVGLSFEGNTNNAITPYSVETGDRDAAVDLGSSSARFKDLYLSGNALITTASGVSKYFNVKDGTNGGDVRFGIESGVNNDGFIGTFTNNVLRFYTNSQEAMRISDDGNLLVGGTSVGALDSCAIENYGGITISRTSGVGRTMVTFKNAAATVGTIFTSPTSTTYATSSDQRLKENIVDAPSASDDIDAIQVRSFDWKADGSHQKYGMVAQELNTVAPEAVSAPEDPEEMMGVDYSKLVPMMLKEIQSLRARVAQLEGAN